MIASCGIKRDRLDPASGVGLKDGKKQSSAPKSGKLVRHRIASFGDRNEVARVRLVKT